MKILASSLISSGPEGLRVHLLKKKTVSGPFASLNDLRLALPRFGTIPQGDLDDFGRGSIAVRYSVLAALFAAGDAGGDLPVDTTVVGWNGRGCTVENLRYWQDFTDNQKAGGRGSLFVATLPTIPYCEAAITLGLHGPSLYLQTEPRTSALFSILASRPTGCCLAGEIKDDSACFFLLDNTPGGTVPEADTLEALFHILAGDGK